MTLNAKIKVLNKYFGYFCCETFQERIAPKSLKIDRDSLRTKLSALNVVFHQFKFRSPWVQEILRTRASNLGTPFKILAFGYSNGSSHARRLRRLAYSECIV